MLYGRLEMLLCTEVPPLRNFSFHLSMIKEDIYMRIYIGKILR